MVYSYTIRSYGNGIYKDIMIFISKMTQIKIQNATMKIFDDCVKLNVDMTPTLLEIINLKEQKLSRNRKYIFTTSKF